ncbi:unnamed protein product [Clonostachys rhizophaga]|uniref:Uncharacterized protein n=1 Tax=Clonostachys rhizophaga TaxID=160324 RepID=A0A9N9VM91_9HYPO|nr:unnamed protein product [Clonostachys rhizophaga]
MSPAMSARATAPPTAGPAIQAALLVDEEFELVDLLDEDMEDEDVELFEEEDVDELGKDEDALDEAEAEDTDPEVGRTAVPVV